VYKLLITCNLRRSAFQWMIVLATVCGLVGCLPAIAQNAPLGTPGALRPDYVVHPEISAPIDPFKTYENASYGTGGIALRNRGEGVLHVSGVSEPIQAAYLYWAILFTGTAPGAALHDVTLRPISSRVPLYREVRLAGTLLGIGADPCWGSSGIAVFRAQVPTWLATGNGAYEVILEKGASGLTDGSDPWVRQAFPEAEGASLVIVGTGAYTVSIYDVGFTATMFYSTGITYTLNLPRVARGGLWDNIGADGQSGYGRVAYPLNSFKITSINGVQIAGPGGPATEIDRFDYNNDSGWNGSAGLPIPQLWDDTGYDISSTIAGTSTATINIEPADDCLGTIANVLAVQ
jgi:hypothetical protein